MLRRCIQLLVVLAPLGAFALALQPVQQRLYGGHATQGILILLGALVILAILEGLLFRYWILPGWSEKVAERLYAGSYFPQDDELAQLADRIEAEKNAELIPELSKLVHEQSWRLRGWLELARLQQDVLHDAEAALKTLTEATHHIHEAEDAALLMFRAAQLCEKNLHDENAARDWLKKLAERHPDTVYGRKASSHT